MAIEEVKTDKTKLESSMSFLALVQLSHPWFLPHLYVRNHDNYYPELYQLKEIILLIFSAVWFTF